MVNIDLSVNLAENWLQKEKECEKLIRFSKLSLYRKNIHNMNPLIKFVLELSDDEWETLSKVRTLSDYYSQSLNSIEESCEEDSVLLEKNKNVVSIKSLPKRKSIQATITDGILKALEGGSKSTNEILSIIREDCVNLSDEEIRKYINSISMNLRKCGKISATKDTNTKCNMLRYSLVSTHTHTDNGDFIKNIINNS